MTMLRRMAQLVEDLTTLEVVAKRDDIHYRQNESYIELSIKMSMPDTTCMMTIENCIREEFADCEISELNYEKNQFLCKIRRK